MSFFEQLVFLQNYSLSCRRLCFPEWSCAFIKNNEKMDHDDFCRHLKVEATTTTTPHLTTPHPPSPKKFFNEWKCIPALCVRVANTIKQPHMMWRSDKACRSNDRIKKLKFCLQTFSTSLPTYLPSVLVSLYFHFLLIVEKTIGGRGYRYDKTFVTHLLNDAK